MTIASARGPLSRSNEANISAPMDKAHPTCNVSAESTPSRCLLNSKAALLVLVYFVSSFYLLPSLPCTRQNPILRAAPNGCKLGGVKTSVDLDPELQDAVDKTVSLVREKPATVLRMAIRAGLPLIASRFQAPRPEGYFAGDYPLPDDRLALEAAMASLPQSPDR
jgi:hypothetical protein